MEIKLKNFLSKKEILKLSYQYQKEWRFQKELALIQEASILYPDWDYVCKRLEWHSRPVFYRAPEKSKTQPRKPLHLSRDLSNIPKKETIDSLCFVTGAGSNAPYFDLVVQLIESIKATRWYNNVPIKILDCGLNDDDRYYLIQRFGVEIKDPGWDVDWRSIDIGRNPNIPLNGWKGAISRPYIHKHFAGYNYYFWIDADAWVQDERVFDKFICLCERQGFVASPHTYDCLKYFSGNWAKNLGQTLTHTASEILNNKLLIANAFYCINRAYAENYADICDDIMAEKQQYIWGFDLAILNYFFYKKNNLLIPSELNLLFIPKHPLFEHGEINNFNEKFEHGYVYVDEVPVYMIELGPFKNHGYRMLFSGETLGEKMQVILKAIELECLSDTEKAEEIAHQLCIQNNLVQANYFYRIYPEPDINFTEYLNA